MATKRDETVRVGDIVRVRLNERVSLCGVVGEVHAGEALVFAAQSAHRFDVGKFEISVIERRGAMSQQEVMALAQTL